MNSSGQRAAAGWSRRITALHLISIVWTSWAWTASISLAGPSERAQLSDAIVPQWSEPAPDLLLSKAEEKKADALAAFVQGIIAEDSADSEAALEAYRRALDLDPSYAELAVKVAYELARRGDVAQGISILKDSIKESPKAPLPHLFLSQLYARFLKKPELALKYATQALELDPQNFAAYLAVFELHLGLGQTTKAEQVLAGATKLENDDPQFWLQLGELYTRLYLKEDGSAAEADLEKINAVYQKALELASEDPAVISKVADYYVLSRQVKKAIPLYLDALDSKEKSSDPALARIREKLARSFLVSGQRAEAIAVLQQIVKESPMRYETYEVLGQLYQQEGETEKALANYQQSILLNPDQPANYIHVADILFRMRQFEKAVEILTDARGRFPDLPHVTYYQALALNEAKRHQEAMTAFEEALRDAEMMQAEMLDGTFFFRYGAVAEQAGLPEKAAELFRKSIELDPANAAQAYNYLGYMWLERDKNIDEAGELIQEALKLEPGNGAYLDSLGWFYFKKGEYERALEELLKAAAVLEAEEDPGIYEIYDHIGDAYAATGDSEKALEYWGKAKALAPDAAGIATKIEDARQKVTTAPPVQAPAVP